MMTNRFEFTVKRLISLMTSALLAVLVTIILSRFTGLYAPYWQGSERNGLIVTVYGWFSQDLILALHHGWLLGLIMMPFYVFEYRSGKLIRSTAWVAIGVLYGCWNLSGGSYVYQGDWSQLVTAPVGVFGALISEPLNKFLWAVIPLEKVGKFNKPIEEAQA